MTLTLTNLIQTPTFEGGSVGGWTASAGTMTVSTDMSAFGTKCLKVTSTAAGQTIVITAPAVPVAPLNTQSGIAVRAASASPTFNIGAHFFNAAGTKVSESMASRPVSASLTRQVNQNIYNFNTTAVTQKPAIQWYAVSAGQSVYIDTVTFLLFDVYDYASHPWNVEADMPDVIGSRPVWGNVTSAWTGTPEASTSTLTSSAAVSLPSPAVRGDMVTITGAGFAPSAQVGLRVSDDDQGEGRTRTPMATVTADATGAFSYSWTVTGMQGSRWIAAQITDVTLGYGAVSSQTVIKSAVADPPNKNYFINPAFRTADGTAPYLFNACINPTPSVNLTGWTPAGAATITRDTAARIVGPSHGARVVSAAATDGIILPGIAGDWAYAGHSVYVRAVTACTLKIATVGYLAPAASTMTAGWGDDGWGGTGYVAGDTITLSAGQGIRARLLSSKGTGTSAGYTLSMKITGTGTYDVDGVWSGMGVRDGEADAPGTVPWFCGDTPDDADFTYEWLGTPGASISRQRGKPALGVSTGEGVAPSTEGVGTEEYDMAHLNTRPDGETTLAIRASQWFYNNNPKLTNAAGGNTTTALGLEIGKSYMLSFDAIMDYPIMPSGYALDGSNGNEFWITVGVPGNYLAGQPFIAIPGRTRFHMPFNVDTGVEQIWLSQDYFGWLLGEVEVSKLAITETTIYSMADAADWIAPVDLTTAGVEPGSTILVGVHSYGPTVNTQITLEAQIGGVWTAVDSVTIIAEDWEMTSEFIATIPAEATGVRLTCPDTGSTGGYFVTDAPPDYFDGSMLAADGWAYSWEGTPDASPSLRTAASSGPTARVFVGGVGIPVSDMRVATVGGTLVPVTEAGG